MRRNIAMLGLAALMALASPQYAKSEPALVGSIGMYVPSGSMDLGGVLMGGEVGVDFGDNHKGLMWKVGFFGRLEALREEFGSNGQVREGEWLSNHMIKASVAGRIGSRDKHVSLGGFVGEADNNYRTLDRRFLGAEVTNNPNSRAIYGPSFGLSLGGRVKNRLRMYVQTMVDVIYQKDRGASPAMSVGLGFSIDPK